MAAAGPQESVPVVQRLLHLLRAGEVVADGRALDGRRPLDGQPGVPALFFRYCVVYGGVGRSEVGDHHLQPLDKSHCANE